ncbi:MAG: di-/tricarboxylate transporter [Nitrososphaeraceae archaeon]|nr:di-/tricarboxylate transporter [Nitrososphaeraceae archaeon]MDF2769786.1 di-/tricarboxylate transporter [Nitrososphaeraceae archaeon]
MGLILGPLLFVVIIFFPTPQSMIEINLENPISQLSPQIALGAMIWMVIWWVTECVPLGFTSLLAPFIFITSGILPVNEALTKFADPIIWIFISGFILAAAFQKCGLDERIAYRLATFYKGNNPKIATFFIASLPVFILSMTGSITASTTIVFPFVVAFMKILNMPIGTTNTNDGGNTHKTPTSNNDVIDNSYPRNVSSKDKRSKYAEASFLSLGQAATAGAMLLLISTAPNLIAKSTVEDFVPDETISFTDWFIIGTPHAIIGLLISWSIIFLIIKPEVNSLSASYVRFRTNLKRMGKITTEEKVVLSILFAALILWIVPSVLRSFYPDATVSGGDSSQTVDIVSIIFYNLAKNVPESVPALLIILAIGLIKLRKSKVQEEEKITNTTTTYPLLSWNEMLKAIDWNIVFLFGGGLVLGLGIESSGLALWIGNQISDNVGANFTASSIFAIGAILGFILSYAASNTASAVITCPIAASLAIGAGFNPIPPIIAAGLGASISSAIPSTTPPMAIIYSSRAVSILNMFKTGMISDLLRLAILIFIGPMLIDLVF